MMPHALETSPCIGLCRIDIRTGYCVGCKRTKTEVAQWLNITDTERETIIKDLKNRDDHF